MQSINIKTIKNFLSKDFIFKIYLLMIFLVPLERVGSFDFGGITIRISQILIIVLLGLYLLVGMYNKKIFIPTNPSFYFYFLFLVACLVSLFGAHEKVRGIMILFFLAFMFVVPFTTIAIVNSKEKLKKVIEVLVFTAIVFAVLGLLQFSGDMIGLPRSVTMLSPRYIKEVMGVTRIQSTFIEPLYFANYLLVPTMISLFYVLKRIDKKGLKKNLSFLLVFIITIILTFSKGAIASLGFLLVCTLIFQIRQVFNKKNLPYLLVIVLFFISLFYSIFMALSSKPDIEKTYTNAVNVMMGGSITERQEAYGMAMDAFEQNKIVGIGVGNFGPYFSGYPTSAPDFGWPIANNQYLEILSETGILGLISFLLFLLSVFYFSIKAYLKTNDLFIKTVLIASSFALLGILVQYLTFSTLYIMHIWVLFGIIFAAQTIALKKEND